MIQEDLLAAVAAQRTADVASLGEMIAAYFPQVFQDKPHSEEEVWKIMCEMLQDLKEAARRTESHADATRSRAESAQKEAGWANRRARSAPRSTWPPAASGPSTRSNGAWPTPNSASSGNFPRP